MSLEKIAQLNTIAKQMEEMKKQAIGGVTDRKELRIQALKKIQEYLKELSKATEGYYWSAETPITIYWLVTQDEVHTKHGGVGVCFYFKQNGEVSIRQGGFASSINIQDFTNLTEFGRVYQDNTFHWEDGMVELINRWKEIKPYLEPAAEKALLERMNKTQKELADFKASYEQVVNFEV